MRLAPGAWRYAAPPLALSVPGLFVSPYAALGLATLGVAVLAFFRDPERTPPREGYLSPADGRVSVVREEGDRIRVGVFMNVTDVHVNRAPAAGTVREVTHVPGAHRPAFTKDSDRNERLHVNCGEFTVTLVAGWFARRIHPYVESGAALRRGQRIGHVAFGSRADVLFPPTVDRPDLRVSEGDAVRAGETVLAARPQDT
ncbi:MAG: protein sorting system archaetidylserine decarboxylase [Halobacteriaceae archaeon]